MFRPKQPERKRTYTFFMSDSRALALLLSLPTAELKHVDWHTGADLFLRQLHSIIEDLEELLGLLLLVQLIVERVLQGDMQKMTSPESYRCPVVNACPVYTWICVFPPLRSAMPSKMLSSKIRSFLVLTMRSMTSSDAPTLSRAHWMSTKLVPGLSESCPGEPPMYTHRTLLSQVWEEQKLGERMYSIWWANSASADGHLWDVPPEEELFPPLYSRALGWGRWFPK